MKYRGLHIAWAGLMALSLASTMLSVPAIWSFWPTAAGVGVMLLAWLKARLILLKYLGLESAPSWQRGFDLTLAIFLLALLALYLISKGL